MAGSSATGLLARRSLWLEAYGWKQCVVEWSIVTWTTGSLNLMCICVCDHFHACMHINR